MICPSIAGSDHFDPKSSEFTPFSVGDINPDGPFIHVLDEVALDVALRELDTVTDFVEYLDAKADLARSGRLVSAAGEEELISYFVTHIDSKGNHAFTHPDNKRWKSNEFVCIEEGFYSNLLNHPQYIRKQSANEISYLWDNLIEHISSNMVDGTLEDSGEPTATLDQERAIRFMALEDRTTRRSHSEAIIGALRGADESGRFFRAMIPPPEKDETIFFVLVLAKPDSPSITDEDYRLFRRHNIYAYGMGLLDRFRETRRVIGIGMQPISDKGTSEDLMLLEPPVWTEALSQEAREICKELGILSDRAVKTEFRVSEYPRETGYTNPVPPAPLTKRQRRRVRGRSRPPKPPSA